MEDIAPKTRSSRLYERKFSSKWLGDPRFSGWLGQSPYNPNKAFCQICERELAGSVTFLERHKSTNKHRTLILHRRKGQLSGSGLSSGGFESEKACELKVAAFLLRQDLPLSLVESLSQLLRSLSPSQSPLTHTRALSLLQSLGEYQRNQFLDSTLKKTKFSLIFLGKKAVIRYVDPLLIQIKTCHFPWLDERVSSSVNWANLIATVNAPLMAVETIQKHSLHTFLRLESLEKNIEDITAFALEALPSECINGSWEIAKFISIKSTDHFREFRDIVLKKGISSDKDILKGRKGLSLEEIVEFITSNWSSVMFWLASVELIEESSSFLQRFYDNTSMELYFAFLNYILPCLSKMKSEFQCEDFRLHRLKSSLQNSVRSILHNFIDSSVISLDKVSNGITSDTYLNLNDVPFWKTFPQILFGGEILIIFDGLDPYNALRRKPASIIPLASKFPNLISQVHYEKLNQEWRELSVYKDDDRLEASDPETFWKKVACEKIGSHRRFPYLSELAMNLMTITHSSVCCLSFIEEANLLEEKEKINDSSILNLLLFSKDYLRRTDSSWEPPKALIHSELSKLKKTH
ncbi:unnamed protein product [Lepeophtheirus salmonis]|uniref:(salmon louse) hypothetical protein n=1 Tax=Lepeophtheirus salmonis TaxID=72036 RepID=A0A7R8CAV0_LEPSM|nr:unnamed protein product [Lepeophtheirus salmonis]CAF2754820.1 unnamed protein product [Lepeophtheirus salmonis]